LLFLPRSITAAHSKTGPSTTAALRQLNELRAV
jgi:hypothetical protein